MPTTGVGRTGIGRTNRASTIIGAARCGIRRRVRAPARPGGDRALACFTVAARQRARSARAMAFGALGAVEVLRAHPGNRCAREFSSDTANVVGPPTRRSDWWWPEPRLQYANAVLAEALLAVGSLPGKERILADGLAMLRRLLATETAGDHLSVTPVDGWAIGEPRPGFDQQPVEVTCLADAWFRGSNDIGVPLLDPDSFGCSDGLEATDRKENQGAESTPALISTRHAPQSVDSMLGRPSVPEPNHRSRPGRWRDRSTEYDVTIERDQGLPAGLVRRAGPARTGPCRHRKCRWILVTAQS